MRLPRLDYLFSLLVLPWPDRSSVHWWHMRLIWAVCRSPVTCLMCLAMALELPNFFVSWHTLIAWNFSRLTLPSLIFLDAKSSSFMKNQKMSWCKILAFLKGYLSRLIWACTALYHSSTLLLPWWKLVSKSKKALTSLDYGLQNSSNLSHIVSKFNSSLGMLQETYWSIPKSSPQAIIFLHCCFSGRDASSHSRMFSHFNLHLRKQWYSPTLTVQSIFGPSIQGMYMLEITWCNGCAGGTKDGWKEISASGSWSELVLSSWLSGTSVSSGGRIWVPQADFLAALGMLGLC